MGNLDDHPRTLSFAYLSCDVCKGTWSQFVSPDEAMNVQVDCSEKSTNHITCKNPEKDLYIEDVGGLAFDIPINQDSLPNLPKLIPTLEKSFIWSDPANIPSDTVSISLGDIFTNPPRSVSGVLKAPDELRFNEKILQSPMFLQKNVILNMSAQDVLIENAWMQQNKISLFSSLRRLGFRFATSPNFSVFIGECPLGHRINQKKSLVCAKLLQEEGIVPIPHIYAMNDFHLEAYIDYLTRYPSIKTIVMNCTLQRKQGQEIKHIHQVLAALLSVRKDLHIILQGINIKDAKHFCEFNANLHYMVSTPHYNAIVRNENVYRDGELRTIKGSSKTRTDLARENIQAYTEFAENVCIPVYK
jgi:hypothetical protein